MSNPKDAIGAISGLQHSQKAAQPALAGKSVANAAFKPAEVIAKADLPGAPAVKAAADVREADIVKPSAKQLQQSLDEINKVMATLSISVQFKIDPEYKELIVNVVDEDTGKLIRQIPTEEVVKMSKAMDSLKGLLFAQSA